MGLSVGLALAGIVVTMMVYFRTLIEAKVMVVEKRIENAGPRPRGFVIEPEDEAEEFRREVMEKNDEAGIDTQIDALR